VYNELSSTKEEDEREGKGEYYIHFLFLWKVVGWFVGVCVPL